MEQDENQKYKVDENYIIQRARKLVGDNPPKLSDAQVEYIIKQAEELLRPRTEEELVQINKELRYPGLHPSLRVKRTYVFPRPKRFFGIMIGWWY